MLHLFNCDSFGYWSLGDNATRILTIYHLIKFYKLNAIVYRSKNNTSQLWKDVFGDKLIESGNFPKADIVHAPTITDWNRGQKARTIFETIIEENGFPHVDNLLITPPLIYPCGDSHSVMIYPEEGTDGNRVYDSSHWLEIYDNLQSCGYRINYFGNKREHLKDFYKKTNFQKEFPATIQGLRDCISVSSLAIGSSTGPTWACLFSNIPQICMTSNKSAAFWNLDRCASVLSKKWHILPTLESLLRPLSESTKHLLDAPKTLKRPTML